MASGSPITAALKWRREYGVSVVPVRYMSKIPLMKWSGWIDRTQPEEMLKLWFRMNHPCNLAVILSDGLCLVDFDDRISYARWRQKMPHIAESLTVKTGRGWHVYLKLEMYREGTYRFDGGEIKLNGIAIVPPSIHSNGREYEWVNENARILGRGGMEDIGVRILQLGARESNSGSGRKASGTIQRIKDNIDIALWLSEYTTLREVGDGSLMGICPFHEDTNPSLVVYPKQGLCYCHSPRCRAHRRTDVISAAAYIFNVSMSQAVWLLASEL